MTDLRDQGGPVVDLAEEMFHCLPPVLLSMSVGYPPMGLVALVVDSAEILRISPV